MANERDTDTDADTRELDQRVRATVYDALFTRGSIPLVAEIAASVGRAPNEICAALQRMTHDHLIVLHPESGEIMMALPFSATPTPFQVEAGGHTYWGNCAWDALGILAMLKTAGRVLHRPAVSRELGIHRALFPSRPTRARCVPSSGGAAQGVKWGRREGAPYNERRLPLRPRLRRC